MMLVLKVTDDDDARDAELRGDLVDPRPTDSCRDPWEAVGEPELCRRAVGFLLLCALGRVTIVDLLDDVVVGVDVPPQDVRDLVEKREQDHVEALAAAGQPDHWVAVDVHRAAVDLGARERVDEHEPYAGFPE